MTVLGRLVSPEEHMAAVVDRLQLFDTDLQGAFLVADNLQAALLGGAHLQGPRCGTRTCAVRSSSTHSSATSACMARMCEEPICALPSLRELGMEHADLRGATAYTKTRWPPGFDTAAAGIQFGADYN